MKAFSIERKSPKIKPECEDASFIDVESGVYVVADGVSRYRYENDYSPSAKVAQIIAAEIGSDLVCKEGNVVGADVKQAFVLGNQVAKEFNKQEMCYINGKEINLWEHTDWVYHDLAGAVAVAAVLQGDYLCYGFIGDCQVTELAQGGEIIWQSLGLGNNKVEQSQHSFNIIRMALPPKNSPLFTSKWEEYIRVVHTQYRNNPEEELAGSHPTYGVINGQDGAMHDLYLFVGTRQLTPENVLLLHSDGLNKMLTVQSFRELLLSGTKEEIENYLDSNTIGDDDIAIIIIQELGTKV